MTKKTMSVTEYAKEFNKKPRWFRDCITQGNTHLLAGYISHKKEQISGKYAMYKIEVDMDVVDEAKGYKDYRTYKKAITNKN